MKRSIGILLTLVLLVATLGTALAASTFAFDRTVLTLYEGETLATVLNREGDTAEGEVTYVSSSPKNATVDQNGVVTGIEKGKTTITANMKVGTRTYRATITLTIARRVTSITVKEDQLAVYDPADPALAGLVQEAVPAGARVLLLPLGKNQRLSATAQPNSANDRTLTLASDNDAICHIASNFTLNPRALGECNVTFASKQTPEVCQVYHVVVVQPVTKLDLRVENATLFVGETTQAIPGYTPSNATVQGVTYSIRNEKIASVDANGVVTALSKGTTYLDATATDGNGRKASTKITVAQQPESITLSHTEATINVGKQQRLTATVLPNNTNDKKVTWQSSDETIATVAQNGTVKGIAPGVCTITCTSSALPQVSAQATVTIQQPVTRIAFTEKSISFNIHSTCQVYWEIEPANASNQAVTFSSNNEKIATVDANGVITGHKRGSCTITIHAADGSGRRGTMKVNVLQPVEGVHMSKDTYRVGVDESLRIQAVLEPSDASNSKMTWVSADSSIVSVRGDNNRPRVTGHRWGETTVTGTTEDGGYTTTSLIQAGNYDKAIRVTDLYVTGNKIKIVAINESNMNVTRFDYKITCYDMDGNPLTVHDNGTNSFNGSYNYTLYEGDSTTHGRFSFYDFVQPDALFGKIEMRITGYRTDDGYRRNIKEENQPTLTYTSSMYIGK